MKKSVSKILGLFMAAVTAVSFSGCFAMQDAMRHEQETNALLDVEWNDEKGTVFSDLRYGNGKFHTYDLFIPANVESERASKLILFIHGGAWMAGEKESEIDWCKYFTVLGYTTATVNYTLLQNGFNPTILSINDEIGMSINAIKDKCLEENLTLDAMALYGFSAGACQAMLYGFKSKNESALPIKFVVQQSGPCSFDPDLWNPQGGTHPQVGKMTGMDGSDEGWASWLTTLSGQEVTVDMVRNGEDEAIWKYISPVTYIDSESVPLLMAYGIHDSVVPPGSRDVVLNAAKAAGIKHDYLLYEHSGHSLTFDLDKQVRFIALFKEYCVKYFFPSK